MRKTLILDSRFPLNDSIFLVIFAIKAELSRGPVFHTIILEVVTAYRDFKKAYINHI